MLKFIKNIETWGVLYIINLKVKEWQLPQLSSTIFLAFYLVNDGRVDVNWSNEYQFDARPVLYLTSFAKITGGTGTSTDPYTLGL